MKIATKLWIGMLILIIFSPLGLLLPHYFKARSNWDESKSNLWNAPLANYTFKYSQDKGMMYLSFTYIISALIGIIIIFIVILLAGRRLSKKSD